MIQFTRGWNGLRHTVSRRPVGPADGTGVTINGQKWEVVEQVRQRTSHVQDLHNHNERTRRGDLQYTLPMADVILLGNMGVNAVNPNVDEERFILGWIREHRPHLLGEKFRLRRGN